MIASPDETGRIGKYLVLEHGDSYVASSDGGLSYEQVNRFRGCTCKTYLAKQWCDHMETIFPDENKQIPHQNKREATGTRSESKNAPEGATTRLVGNYEFWPTFGRHCLIGLAWAFRDTAKLYLWMADLVDPRLK